MTITFQARIWRTLARPVEVAASTSAGRECFSASLTEEGHERPCSHGRYVVGPDAKSGI